MSALCACVASASLDFFVAPNRLLVTGCTAASAPLNLRKKKLHAVVLHMFVSYQNTRSAVSNQDVFWWGSGLCLALYM